MEKESEITRARELAADELLSAAEKARKTHRWEKGIPVLEETASMLVGKKRKEIPQETNPAKHPPF
jgi:hypothetical protein